MKLKADDLELVALILLLFGFICSIFSFNQFHENLNFAAMVILVYPSVINIKNKINRRENRAKR